MNYLLYREGDASPADIVEQMKEPIELVMTKTKKLEELKGPGLVFRFGTTATVPKFRERALSIVNTAAEIHEAFDKHATRKALKLAGISIPDTFDDLEHCPRPSPATPLIVRPRHHGRQSDFHVVKNLRELVAACDKCGEGYYISTFIPKEKEYRVHVFNRRVVAITDKVPNNPLNFAWGVRDIVWTNVRWGQWPLGVADIAINATAVAGLEWAAVDVIVDKDGKAYVLELNTAPHLSWYEASCYAAAFDYMIGHKNRNHRPINGLESWRDFIHPCKSQEARV